ncbi:MAG: YgiQ family radical SAM protein [Sphaerochaetaceae bacterium]
MNRTMFLPTTMEDVRNRGWNQIDIALISADAYVDHPSFAVALIGRLLENKGFKVGVISQPDWRTTTDFLKMGQPRLCAMISGGNIDSMVLHYTANNKPRKEDEYSPGGKSGYRPDRPTIVYASRARQAYGKGIPLIIGGLEASLRRMAHYDFWSDLVRKSILLDSKADLLIYGMGENPVVEIAQRLDRGESIIQMRDIRGTVFATNETGLTTLTQYPQIMLPTYEQVSERDIESNTPTKGGKRWYAQAFQQKLLHENPINPEYLIQKCMERYVVQEPPSLPLTTKEFDELYSYPYTLDAHPDYDKQGGVPALQEVQFSLTSNRGCYGACSFCAITSHQGRMIQTRSIESLVAEATRMARHPLFKGYIHDVGGPTANFQGRACDKQEKCGPCVNRECLWPEPCPNLKDSHQHYLDILEAIEAIPRIKKVYIRSGLRFDYLMTVCKEPIRSKFLSHLVGNNISGQLKIAPEHISPEVLDAMGKPKVELYEKFCEEYQQENQRQDKKQYLVPYFIAAHPGSTLTDAINLALYMQRKKFIPEQVQEFYPTPGTVSTTMYYTGLDPRPGKDFAPIYVPKGRERSLQRALLQYDRPENKPLVREALQKAGMEDAGRVLFNRYETR